MDEKKVNGNFINERLAGYFENAKIPENLSQFLEQLVVLAESICSKNDFDITRQFECLMRDYLVMPKNVIELDDEKDANVLTADDYIVTEDDLKRLSDGNDNLIENYVKLFNRMEEAFKQFGGECSKFKVLFWILCHAYNQKYEISFEDKLPRSVVINSFQNDIDNDTEETQASNKHNPDKSDGLEFTNCSAEDDYEKHSKLCEHREKVKIKILKEIIQKVVLNFNQTEDFLRDFSRSLRYVAFYCLCTKLRRSDLVDTEELLFDFFKDEFRGYYKSIKHIELESFDFEPDERLAKAEALVKEMENQAGIYILFSVIIDEFATKDSWPEVSRKKELLEKAKSLIKEADKLEYPQGKQYPKTSAVSARISMHLGEYDEALGLINEAIKRQKKLRKNESDFYDRMNTFHTYKSDISYGKNQAEMNKVKYEVLKELEGQNAKHIEILAIFTAIIAIIVTVAGGLGDFCIADMFFALVSLFGLIIISFSLLHLLLFSNLRQIEKPEKISLGLALAIGMAMVIATIFYIYFRTDTFKSLCDTSICLFQLKG